MYELNERQIECIRLLLLEQEFCPASYFSEKLCVSDKTLLQDLKEIQKYLDEFGVILERKTGRGLYLGQGAKENKKLLDSLEEQLDTEKAISIDLRRREILRKLLTKPGTGVSIQTLSEEFHVSRASIVNDFKHITNKLVSFDLRLVKKVGGRCVSGDENNIRQAIAAMLSEYQNQEDFQQAKGYSRLNKETKVGLTEFFTIEDVDFVENMIIHLENICGHLITEPCHINLLTHILICLVRTRAGKQVEQAEGTIDINTYKSYEYGKSLAGMIRDGLGLDIGETETYYIYKYLVSAGIGVEVPDRNTAGEQKENTIFDSIVKDLSACVLKALHIERIGQNKRLEEGLLLHVRSMLNRLKYDIKISSDILEEIQIDYGPLLGLCQAAMWCISQKYSLKEAGLDEISYIATYYQTMVETGQQEKRILVVCHGGYGTSQLLAAKLKQSFSWWKITDVISTRQLEHRNLENVDFIISTVPLEVKKVPYIMVSAILSENDIHNIQNTLLSEETETVLSLPMLEEQYRQNRFLLTTTTAGAREWEKEKSKHITKKISWGGSIQIILGISQEAKSMIYKIEGHTQKWVIVTYAPTYDEILKQISELYQILCTPGGNRKLTGCHSTEDLESF